MENTAIPHKINSVSSYIKAIFDMRNAKYRNTLYPHIGFFEVKKTRHGECALMYSEKTLWHMNLIL